MNIYFCDLCNESVPLADLDAGKARRIGERVVCAQCEAAMSAEPHAATLPAAGAPAKVASVAEAAGLPPAGPGDETTVVEVSTPVTAPAAQAAPASAGAAVGVALASVALLLAVGATAFLFDQIDVHHQQALAAVEQNRTDAQERVHSMDTRISGELREATQELGDSRTEISELRTRLEELGNHQRESLENLREDLVRVTQRTQELDTTIAAVERHEAELSKVAETAAMLHGEVRKVTDRINNVEESGERLLSEAAVAKADTNAAGEAPPEWMGIVADLKSQNSGTRWQAVQSLGATRDSAVAEHLTPMLKDPDIFVRMATARILGDLEAVVGIPALIDALEDPEASVREASVVSLRAITGRDFRFDPGAKESERAKRVKAWRDWWKKASEELLGGNT